MRRVHKVLAVFIFCAFGLLRAESAHAGERVWSAMLFATNAEGAKPFPSELTNFKAKLTHVFGYKQFEVIDSRTETMEGPGERWVLPSKHFSLSVAATAAGKSIYDVKVQLFHEQKRLVETEATLGAASPLFIRGPLCGSGQLIFVFVIKPQTVAALTP